MYKEKGIKTNLFYEEQQQKQREKLFSIRRMTYSYFGL